MPNVIVPGYITIEIPGYPPLLISELKKSYAREMQLKHLRWILGAWAGTVMDAYEYGAPRTLEVRSVMNNIRDQLKPHLDENEWHQFRKIGYDDRDEFILGK